MPAQRPFDLDAPRLVQLQQATAGRQVVQLRYHSYRSDVERERDEEPETRTYHNGAWYLGGFCRLRQGPRSFRLNRSDGLRVLDEHFTARSAVPATVEPVTVRVRFAAATLRWVRERQHFGYVAEILAAHYATSQPRSSVVISACAASGPQLPFA